MLTRGDLLGSLAPPFTPGLLIVEATADDMGTILVLPNIAPIHIELSELLTPGVVRQRQIHDASVAINAALQHGVTPVAYTDCWTSSASTDDEAARAKIAHAIAEIVIGIKRRPAFTIVLGCESGMSELLQVFGLQEDDIVGEIAPEVAARKATDDARFPGMPVIFVPGSRASVAETVKIIVSLRGGR